MRNRILVVGAFAVPFLLSSCSFLSHTQSPISGGSLLACRHAPVAKTDANLPIVKNEITQLPVPEWPSTPEVTRELHQLLGPERYFLEQSLERREHYLPLMQQIFKDEGVPVELLDLALIESGFNPNARSPVGAVGIWQFMRKTAEYYGLRVDRKEDQRKDPILSSIAAARLLRDLYATYSDWSLALAAYNAGAGGVSRALQRAGVDDYWSLIRKRRLCAQTSRYVPRVIAAAIITKNLAKYDLATMAQNLELLLGDGDGSVEVARWTGDRYPSAG